MTRKIFILFIFFLWSFAAVGQSWDIGSPNAADVVATTNGYMGTTLHIKGMGETKGYNLGSGIFIDRPWQNYSSFFSDIIVEDGITKLGNAIFAELTRITSLNLPHSLQTIDDYAFANCIALKTVTIPPSCDVFGVNVFTGCRNLRIVVNNNPTPQLINEAFNGLDLSRIILIVPCGSVKDYKNADGWKHFGKITEKSCSQSIVSNVQTLFSCSGEVTITYDLKTTDPTDATLYYSPDNGTTWLVAQSVSGDLLNQSTGTGKTITWNNATDNVNYGKFKLKVETPYSDVKCVEIAGSCWATRNVDMPGTFTLNPEDKGMLYQWNRNVGWSNTDPMINSNGNNIWDYSIPNGAQWEKTKDPCPKGYRIPTLNEWINLYSADVIIWTDNYNETGNKGLLFGSGTQVIFFPASVGMRYDDDGKLDNSFTNVECWSTNNELYNNPNNVYAYTMITSPSDDPIIWYADYIGTQKNTAISVRCVKE
ncbi:MAG: leucine-rich repeat protein [Bacteroidales bacterium]|jgi:uncharacterized protein (TIGR02145 family)|nr:leucine-rich repeat protein [Bacteroidales bacterium]